MARRGPGSNQHADQPPVARPQRDPDPARMAAAAGVVADPELDAESNAHTGPTVGGHQLRPGAHLAGADLAGKDLRGAPLWNANLAGANLTDADLTGAELWNADLRAANLQGANLTGANTAGAKLAGARVDGRTAGIPDGWRRGDGGRLERAPAVDTDDLYDDDALTPDQ